MSRSRWSLLTAALAAGCGAVTSFDGFSDRVDDAPGVGDAQADGALADGALADAATDGPSASDAGDAGDAGGDGDAGCVLKTTGYLTGTVAADVSADEIAWTNVSNALALDGQTASVAFTTIEQSHVLFVRGFGANVPAGAAIAGLAVSVVRSGNGAVEDESLRLAVDNGSGALTYGADRRSDDDWPSSLGTKTYTPTIPGWGMTLTPQLVTSSLFGVALQAKNLATAAGTGSVDAIRMSIQYCE